MFKMINDELVAYKFEEPDIEINILKDQLDSYQKYLQDTIHNDIDYLCYVISTVVFPNERKGITASVRVGNRVPAHNNKEALYIRNMYYPVYVTFYVNNTEVVKDLLLFKIPYMNEYCVLNVKGKLKFLINEMVRADDITYDKSHKHVIVNMPDIFFRIYTMYNGRDLTFEILGNKVNASSLIYAFAKHYGNTQLNYKHLFSNALVHRALFESNYDTNLGRDIDISNSRIISNLIPGYGMDLGIASQHKGKLGFLRKNINKKLDPVKAIGKVLSRDIGVEGFCVDKGTILTANTIQLLLSKGITKVQIELYPGNNMELDTKDSNGFKLAEKIESEGTFFIPKGTEITKEIILQIKKHRINEIYIRDIPKIVGMKISRDYFLKGIPKGTKITKYVKQLIPSLADTTQVMLSEDYPDVIVYFKKKRQLTQDHLQLLYDCGKEEIPCLFQDRQVTFKFEQDIIGNYTCQAKYLVDDVNELPEDISGDTWIYYKDLGDTKDMSNHISGNYLNLDDILGIISYAGRVLEDDILNERTDSDLDFIKKINMCCEIFSGHFKSTAELFVRKWKDQIKKLMNQDLKNTDEVFQEFGDLWITSLWKDNLLRDSKDQTPLAIITQANKVLVPTINKQSVSEGQRILAMGFYGKSCAYDVPQGANIGLVQTLAAGTRIKDGIPHAAYRRIITKSGKRYISTNAKDIVWLNAEQEADYIIADMESLHFNSDNSIVEEMVLARVPADEGEEKVKPGLASTKEIDFVNALGEETLSPGAQIIPYANSDDPVRINFGISLFMNSIYTQGGEPPWTYTSMYKHMYTYSNEFLVRAEDDGYVVDIQPNSLTVIYKNDPEKEVTYALQETKMFNNCILTMNYKKKIRESFNKGDVLVDTPVSKDGFYSPGSNVIVAYFSWGGFNYEDASLLSTHCSYKFVSVGTHKVRKSVGRDTIETPRFANKYKYIPKHGVIDTVTETHRLKQEIVTSKEWKTSEHSGILYSIERDQTSEGNRDDEKALVAKLLSFNKVKTGDKMSGRHGNKGATALVERNSKMPMFYNGVVSELLANPLGIGSRMNPGQVDDAILGFAGMLLKTRIQTNSFNGASIEDIAYITHYVYDIANAEISDLYLLSFYRNNSRILIETCKAVLEMVNSLSECSKSLDRLKSKINVKHSDDIEKAYNYITENKDMAVLAANDEKDIQRFLFDAKLCMGEINITYMNLLEGFNLLLQKISKSKESVHKEVIKSFNAIDSKDNYSDTRKQQEKIFIIYKYIRTVAENSLIDITSRYTKLPKELHEKAIINFWEIKEWEGCFFADGTAIMYNPDSGKPYEGHVQFGVPYFLKIVQEVDEKIGARAGMLTEKYTMLEHQPPQGASRGGGQREGEMELAAMSAFGASSLIYEVYNTCSDNIGAQTEALCKALKISSDFIDKEQYHPKTVDLLRYILEAENIGMNISNYPGIDRNTIRKLKRIKGPGLFRHYLKERIKEKLADEEYDIESKVIKSVTSQFTKNNLGDLT